MTFCNAVADEPGPLPARCSLPPHETGDHDWTPSAEVLARVDLQRQAITSETAAAINQTRHQAPATPTAVGAGDRLPARGAVRRVKARWSV
jgi:hypothetical protein